MKSGEKWEKVGKVGKSGGKLGKGGEKCGKWGKVTKSGEKLEKVGKNGEKFLRIDHSSCHFRSIRNFWDWTTMSVIELVRDIWMNNACVKFEERSLDPSKVIALTTKL